MIGVLGNNAPGARWVYSAKHQQKFHAESGFRTDEQVVKDNEREVMRIFDFHVRRAIR
jgi:nitrite reductase/ring-hydroxylating ferredoxin subunit